jgi:3'(2'), 5'-bisphosphate nucleotidase
MAPAGEQVQGAQQEQADSDTRRPGSWTQPMRIMLEEELETAAALARLAGRAVMPMFGAVVAEEKAAGSPVTAADRLANRIIVSGLQARFPDDAILSEESVDSADRLSRARVWVIDPLDGTREFMAGIGEFAVMIGLAVAGRAVLGVVYCPADDVLYLGVPGAGAWTEQGGRRPLRAHPMPGRTPRLVGSRSHPDARLQRIREELGVTSVRPAGSVGVKCALVARGEGDLYVHPVPYLKEWDTCAPEAVLRAAGGDVTDCHGQRLRYNKPDPIQPAGIVAAAPGLLVAVIATVRAVFDAEAEPAAVAS